MLGVRKLLVVGVNLVLHPAKILNRFALARVKQFDGGFALLVPQLSRLLGRYDEDTLTLGVQTAMRNMGVSLLMARFFFPGQPEQGHVLYTCLFYAGTAVWYALPSVVAHRLGWPIVLGRARRRRTS